nr:hypothetical protein BSM_03680 [uncultured archaeon]
MSDRERDINSKTEENYDEICSGCEDVRVHQLDIAPSLTYRINLNSKSVFCVLKATHSLNCKSTSKESIKFNFT